MYGYSNMSLGHRTMVTVVIVVVILLILAFVGYISGRWEEAQAQQLPMEPVVLSKYEKHFIDLDRVAIADAYKEQIHHLFLTWAKDDSQQPKRAVVGAKQARSMYERSMAAIDEREQRLKGTP